jgi:hypothetical protein
VPQKVVAAVVLLLTVQGEMAEQELFQIFRAHQFSMVAVAHRWGLGHRLFMAQQQVVVAFPRLTTRM